MDASKHKHRSCPDKQLSCYLLPTIGLENACVQPFMLTFKLYSVLFEWDVTNVDSATIALQKRVCGHSFVCDVYTHMYI